MAKAAEAALNLDLPASWVVGDRPEDIGLAEAVGASAVYLGTDDCQRPRRLVFPEPGGRGPVHPGAYCGMSSFTICRPQSPAADGAAVKFPMAPYIERGVLFRCLRGGDGPGREDHRPRGARSGGRILVEAYTRGARMFSCGNGGSASIANHLQCDHVKGVRTEDRPRPRVLSLSTNVELLTAIANDIGYENVFVYQLQSQSRPGDVLIAVSSSGRSPNIVQALTWARDNGLRTIAITGFDGGAARTVAEVSIHVDCTNYGIVEDLHQSRHACSGPVHPPVANDRRCDPGERVLNHDSHREPGHDADGGRSGARERRPAGAHARGDQPPDRRSRRTRRVPTGSGRGSSPRWPSGWSPARNCTCW